MEVIGEFLLDTKDLWKSVPVRLFSPEPSGADEFSCHYSVGAPIGREDYVLGASRMQALCLGLNRISICLYANQLHHGGDIGFQGVFGRYLGLPAPLNFQDIAPYPFADGEDWSQPITEGSPNPAAPLLVEQILYLSDRPETVGVRIFAPQQIEADDWTCAFELDPPVAGSGVRRAASSLQALMGAVQGVSSRLYGSEVFRQGQLWASLDNTYDLGPYTRYLWIPSPHGDPALAPFAF